MPVFRAPGRVNLIGEHTDYNLGLVLPMALDLATFVTSAPSPDRKLRIYSEQYNEKCVWQVRDLPSLERAGHWSDYPIGVAQQLIRAGFPIEPASLLIRSTVPDGAGLSSSAALEVASALALLNGRAMPPLDLARLCLRAEQEFVGLPCGIMDQYVAIFGREHSAVEIDCRTQEHRMVRLPEGIAFFAVNTMVKHALAGSAYADRVRECAAGMESRIRHVTTENERVRRFVEACEHGDTHLMGDLMVESHRSLRHDYEVSCAELDFLVDAALAIDGVYGSRMTGGGFGGCTVTMLRPEAVERFREEIVRAYESAFHIRPEVYECRASRGAGEER